MDELSRLNALSQQALLVKKILDLHGVKINVSQAQDILAQSSKSETWDLPFSGPAGNKLFNDDLLMVLITAIQLLTDIAFPCQAGVPSKCKIMGVTRLNKFYGLEIDSGEKIVEITLDEHPLGGIGYCLFKEILRGLAKRTDLAKFKFKGNDIKIW